MISLSSIFIILSIIAATFSASLRNWDESKKLNIVNPGYTNLSTHSFTVAVTIGLDLLGGGVLVSQRWVLTAASVSHGRNISELRVRLGSNSSEIGGKLHKIHGVVEHPDYNPDSGNSISLLYLDRNVSYVFSRHISFLARVPFQNDRSYGNLTGFGQKTYLQTETRTKNSAKVISQPHKSKVPNKASNWISDSPDEGPGLEITSMELYSRDYCLDTFGQSVPDNQFCGFSVDGSLPCFGDIGDPLTKCVNDMRCELLGVYSGYNMCGGDPYLPQTYVDIGQYRDWIKSIIRQNRTEQYEQDG